ncbi:M56 family peptidase, partial [Streptomyces sp. NPDC059627]
PRPRAPRGVSLLPRGADAAPAARLGDRTVVARAVGRAALASAKAPGRATLAATGGAVPQRVRALLAPPPPRRALPLVAGAALLALSCTSLAEAASDSEHMIDGAQFVACVTAHKATGMVAPPAHGPCGHPPHDHDGPGRHPH